MGIAARLTYIAMAALWAHWVTTFFNGAGHPTPPHLQSEVLLYMALAHVATILLVLAALTSRVTRHGYVLRWTAIAGVGTTLAFLVVAFVFGVAFFIIGGKLPGRVTTPVQWGSAALGLALAALLLDVAFRTRDLVTSRSAAPQFPRGRESRPPR